VFDFRPLYGDTTLVDQLRDWLEPTRATTSLSDFMTHNALDTEPRSA
jgi:signal-transduction protein with cAMP-binding, CBS, and nucleotidyltransferase domain